MNRRRWVVYLAAMVLAGVTAGTVADAAQKPTHTTFTVFCRAGNGDTLADVNGVWHYLPKPMPWVNTPCPPLAYVKPVLPAAVA